MQLIAGSLNYKQKFGNFDFGGLQSTQRVKVAKPSRISQSSKLHLCKYIVF